MSNDLSLDRSGNGNNWTANNISFSDQMIDTPTNNFCTLNPLHLNTRMTYSEGNTKYTATYNNSGCMSSFGIPLGTKFYWEFVQLTWGGSERDDAYIGVNIPSVNLLSSRGGQTTSHSYGSYYGEKKIAGTTSSYGAAWGTNDIIGIAIDRVNHTPEFFKNGSSQGTFSISATEEHFPWFGSGGGNTHANAYVNFGQDSSFAGNKTAQGNSDGGGIGDFYYTPPSGFLALCTKNLPDPAVIPSEHFNTVLWSGTGVSLDRSITGVGFQPDFTWIKNRSAVTNHTLFDSIRGSGKELKSNGTNADQTDNTYGYLDTFDSDGFTVIRGTVQNDHNISGNNQVAWNWKANGTGVSNTSGSITSTVSANVDAGFSIVSYTGNGSNATVGHGLSKAPEMMIVKSRDEVKNWAVYSNQLVIPKWLQLEQTNAASNASTVWNSTAPTSSVLSIGTATVTNVNTKNYIGYMFHSVDGYSKVGSYTGNGSTDGTFVYTGFRPALLLIKCSSASGTNWTIIDSEVNPYNEMIRRLTPNSSEAEQVNSNPKDFLSNGFKLRTTGSYENGNGNTYIFYAVAEHPFKHTNAR